MSVDKIYKIHRMRSEDMVKSFKCTNGDLNDFLINDAIGYQNQLLAVTYLVIDPEEENNVAFFSLLNDHIRFSSDSKSARNHINRHVPHTKQRNHYPAVKLGRLAVTKDAAHNGIGEYVIDYIKYAFTHGNRTGCRILTVDAYIDAVGFYEKNGFRFFTETDANDETRLMYYDLKSFL